MRKTIQEFLEPGVAIQKASVFRKAIEALADGDTLALGGGRIDISPEGAFQKFYHISNNTSGEKTIVFPLLGKKNITIDGEGAALVFHGSVMPFCIDGSENITIQNLSVDYRYPRYAQGKIVAAERGKTVLEFDGQSFFARAQEGEICFWCPEDGWETRGTAFFSMEFDAENKAPSAYLPYYVTEGRTFQQISENRILMNGDPGFVHTVGNWFVMLFTGRVHPCFFLQNAKDITIRDIRVYESEGMGVMAQISENITLERIHCDVPESSDRVLAMNADATHFLNCRGKICIRDCFFLRMIDDAGNVHGTYMAYPEKQDAHTIQAYFGHEAQCGVNIFRQGDRAACIDCETLEVHAIGTVEASEMPDAHTLRLTFRETMPDIQSAYVIENISTAPEVEITGCETGYNRPRGFLLSTRGKVLVENNIFYNMNEAIRLGGEMAYWFESGPALDVTIRHNEFRNSAYAGGAAICSAPSLQNPTNIRTSYNGRVVIEENHFTQNGKRFLVADCVQNLCFRNNQYTYMPDLPFHKPLSESGAIISRCDEVLFSPVQETD